MDLSIFPANFWLLAMEIEDLSSVSSCSVNLATKAAHLLGSHPAYCLSSGPLELIMKCVAGSCMCPPLTSQRGSSGSDINSAFESSKQLWNFFKDANGFFWISVEQLVHQKASCRIKQTYP